MGRDKDNTIPVMGPLGKDNNKASSKGSITPAMDLITKDSPNPNLRDKVMVDRDRARDSPNPRDRDMVDRDKARDNPNPRDKVTVDRDRAKDNPSLRDRVR